MLGTLIVGALVYILISRTSPEGGREHHTPTNVYVVTAGAMSLLIAFTMSLTYAQYSNAQTAATQEANAVIAMSRAATFMKPTVRDSLRNELVCYGQAVMTDEWDSMRNGHVESTQAVSTSLRQMDDTLLANVDAAGTGLSMWESANEQRATAREQRLSLAGEVVPPILWLLLIFGSLITLGSLLVFADSSKPAWGHALVIIGPLFVASAALVVIYFFDHPYADTPGAVQPGAMGASISQITTEKIEGVPLPSCVRLTGAP